MTAIAAPARLRSRRPMLLAAAAALAAAVLAGGVLLWLGGEEGPTVRTTATASGAFELSYPPGWEAAGARELLTAAGRPDSLLHRPDGRGVVTVHEQPRLDGSLAAVERGLKRRVRRTMPDAREVAARVVRLATGPALSYTFVRERSGVVHGIVVAPAGDRTVTIETAAGGDAADVARETGAIVRSLRPSS